MRCCTQVPGHARARGYCVHEGLTETGKVGVEVALQLMVPVVMVIAVAGARWMPLKRRNRSWCPCSCSCCPRHPGMDSASLLHPEGDPRGAVPVGDYGTFPPTRASLDVDGGGSTPRSYQPDPAARYVTAAVNFLLTAYGAVSQAVIRMLVGARHAPGFTSALHPRQRSL